MTTNSTSLEELQSNISVFTDEILANTSIKTNYETGSKRFYLHEIILIALSAGTVAFVTMTGNLLVITAFAVNKKLRNLNNYFLASLSIADFSIGLVSMPFYTVYILVGHWPFGALPCDLWLSMDYTMSNASTLHLVLICLDRFLSAKRPLTYRANRTSGRVLKMIIASWIISILLWPPLIFAMPYIEGGRTVPENDCYIQFLYSNEYLTIITHILAFWLPVAIMISLYQRVYHTTQKHKRFKAMYANKGSSLSTVSIGRVLPKTVSDTADQCQTDCNMSGHHSVSKTTSNSKTKAEKENDKAAKTLSAILLAFIITWMPYHVNVIISAFCQECVPSGVYHFGYWLCYLNSTINPILYALCNVDFRWTFLKILSCNFKGIKAKRVRQKMTAFQLNSSACS